MSHSADRPANRLADQTSPYLQQHAYNPVDWYPWGDEALQKARREDLPIFLSIGYSACHWCHVMERESFEDESIAAFLNEHFVSIKVDREERPDLDSIYMSAVMAMTGSGGWPMSVFLTPDGRPFYGGTYFPPRTWGQRVGFPDLLKRIHDAWTTQRAEINSGADELTRVVIRMATPEGNAAQLTIDDLNNAAGVLISAVDRENGGFGSAPKFPHPMDLRVLMRFIERSDVTSSHRREAESVLRLTLNKMAAGGIYDHLGGGFHRYSTDARWLAPHFEKMLYDNALLTVVYLEAYLQTGHADDLRVVNETLDYVLREMTSDAGGFFATQDADSEGEEGRFFVWNESEIDQLLDAKAATLFKAVYDVTPGGNWEGKTILNRTASADRSLAEFGFTDDVEGRRLLEGSLKTSRQRLFDSRRTRIAPGTDEKLLSAWNGLMITAFAKAAAVTGETRYHEAAVNACRFVTSALVDDSGRLQHSFKDGVSSGNAFLDDYAGMIEGLTETFLTTGDAQWLTHAITFADQMLTHFADPNGRGFFYTSDDHEKLITRQKDSQDSATPSGNSLAATALLKLAAITNESRYAQAAEATLQLLSGTFRKHPTAGGQALVALDWLIGPVTEYVLVDSSDSDGKQESELEQQWRAAFRPRSVFIRRRADEPVPESLSNLLTGRDPQPEPMLYVCQNQTCDAPVAGAEAIRNKINE